MLSPAESFLCCFSLSVGVKLTLWFNLVRCVFCAGVTMSSLVFDSGSTGYGTSATMQICEAAWGLVGVPIILVALWAVYNRVEFYVRNYLYYAFVDLVFDAAVLGYIFIIRDACTQLKPKSVGNGGEAFACGVARGMSIAVLLLLMVVNVYVLHVVWSYCEELTDGGSAAAIAGLLNPKQSSRTAGLFHAVEGLDPSMTALDAGYDSLAGTLHPFGGRAHTLGAGAGPYQAAYLPAYQVA